MLDVRKLVRMKSARASSAIGCICVLLLSVACRPALAADAVKSSPVKIAVFDLELEDVSPASAFLGQTTSSAATMEKVSSEARRVLTQSGRYSLIDVSGGGGFLRCRRRLGERSPHADQARRVDERQLARVGSPCRARVARGMDHQIRRVRWDGTAKKMA